MTSKTGRNQRDLVPDEKQQGREDEPRKGLPQGTTSNCFISLSPSSLPFVSAFPSAFEDVATTFRLRSNTFNSPCRCPSPRTCRNDFALFPTLHSPRNVAPCPERPSVLPARDNHPRCCLPRRPRRRYHRPRHPGAIQLQGYGNPAAGSSTMTVSSWSPSLSPDHPLSSYRIRKSDPPGISGSFLLQVLSMDPISAAPSTLPRRRLVPVDRNGSGQFLFKDYYYCYYQFYTILPAPPAWG